MVNEGPDPSSPEPRGGGPVVVLAGPGDASDILVHFLAAHVPDVTVIMEQAQSRVTLARRRASKLGWFTVVGQVLFIVLAMPVLRRQSRKRKEEILAREKLDAAPILPDHRVSSVNDSETIGLLREAKPAVVVLSGTRIVSRAVLNSVDCPFVNLHAGITPQYRGVHGGYWALAEGQPDLVGSTVHLVDPGIDTGAVLARTVFTPHRDDSIATYPYLHLAAGLPALVEHVVATLDGGHPRDTDVPASDRPSRLFSHPTLWGYLWRRLTINVK